MCVCISPRIGGVQAGECARRSGVRSHGAGCVANLGPMGVALQQGKLWC